MSRFGENGVVISGEQAIWPADLLGMRSDGAVDNVGNWQGRSVSTQSLSLRTEVGRVSGVVRRTSRPRATSDPKRIV